ncbi:MAG: hypothetical protein M3N17_00040 [Actinomycetota bacterium]|nr:hypothetical protein [Actinomycetota bacterium]
MSGTGRQGPGRRAVAVVVGAVLVVMWQALAPGYSDEAPVAEVPAVCESPARETADTRRADLLTGLRYMSGFDYGDSGWARGSCPPGD